MRNLLIALVIVGLCMASAFAANVYIEGPDQRTTPTNEDGIQPPGTGKIAVRVLLENIPKFGGIQFALQFKHKATGVVSNAFTVAIDDRPWDPDNGKPWFEGVGYSWHNDGRYEWGAIPDDPDTQGEDESQSGLAVRDNNICGHCSLPIYVPTENPMTTFGIMCCYETDVTTKVWVLKLYFDYNDPTPGVYDIVFNMSNTLVAADGYDITDQCTIINGTVTIGGNIIITVDSAPITSVPITGSFNETTPFIRAFGSAQDVTLTAPVRIEREEGSWGFSRWTVDLVDQPLQQASIVLRTDASHHATANYRFCTLFVSASCVTSGDGRVGNPFCTIQAGVDVAQDGDTVVVLDGTYTGPGNRDITFRGKAITVKSQNGPTHCVVNCQGSLAAPHSGFVFENGEGPDSIVEGFMVRGGFAGDGGGIYCNGASPEIRHCILTGNTAYYGAGVFCFNGAPGIVSCTIANNNAYAQGGGVCSTGESAVAVGSSIIWGNSGGQIAAESVSVSFCDVQGGYPGDGNIDADPQFADPAARDYHLRSLSGRWDPVLETWVADAVWSPCIDAGSLGAEFGNEPAPNGLRLNMGAYGNTGEASKSPRIVRVTSLPCVGLAITGDLPGTTDYSTPCEGLRWFELHAPPAVIVGGARYGFLHWLIDGQAASQTVDLLFYTGSEATVLTAVYEALPWTLGVMSTPITGVGIAGERGGLTDYELSCDPGEVVSLTAPDEVTVELVRYRFVVWRLDGLDQEPGNTGISVTMRDDHEAVAAYEIVRHLLTVKSLPVSGFTIGGLPDATECSILCDDRFEITLTAPPSPYVTGTQYWFVRWLLGEVEKPLGQTSVTLMMDGPRMVTAVYMLAGDVNGDCAVNVLDLICLRNHLRESPSSGENWRYDLNRDGRIDVLDLIAVRNRMSARCR